MRVYITKYVCLSTKTYAFDFVNVTFYACGLRACLCLCGIGYLCQCVCVYGSVYDYASMCLYLSAYLYVRVSGRVSVYALSLNAKYLL